MASLMADQNSAAWIVGFHAQQSVEKAIKAVLAECGIEFPLTHDLVRLLELLPDAAVQTPPDAAELAILNPYGAMFRYEDQGSSASSLDQGHASELVARTVEWAELILKI
jgi:HEPN domain-containing protein